MRLTPAAESFLGELDGIYEVATGVIGVALGGLGRVRGGE